MESWTRRGVERARWRETLEIIWWLPKPSIFIAYCSHGSHENMYTDKAKNIPLKSSLDIRSYYHIYVYSSATLSNYPSHPFRHLSSSKEGISEFIYKPTTSQVKSTTISTPARAAQQLFTIYTYPFCPFSHQSHKTSNHQLTLASQEHHEPYASSSG